MKKYLAAVACTALSVSLVACGKKDQPAVDPSVNVAPVVATAPVGTYYPVQYNGMPFQQYCQMYNGSFNGTICSITQTQYGSQWNIQIGTLNTGIAVYSGQRLAVSDSGNPGVYISGVNIGSGNVNVVANLSGYLTFQKGGFSTYSVSTIQLTTCLSAPAQATPCP
jgi:hypothetical protein